MMEAAYDTIIDPGSTGAVDWIPKGGPDVDPSILKLDEKAKGLHKMICFETRVLPARCYFKGSDENRTLHIVVTRESLQAEPLRVPSPDHPDVVAFEEAHWPLTSLEGTQGAVYADANDASDDETYAAYAVFPKRRGVTYSEEKYAQLVDNVLYIPFDIEFVNEADLRG